MRRLGGFLFAVFVLARSLAVPAALSQFDPAKTTARLLEAKAEIAQSRNANAAIVDSWGRALLTTLAHRRDRTPRR